MTISLLTVITALGWIGAIAVVLAYGMVSRGRWTADSLPFQLSNFAGAAVMLVIAIVNGIWPSALANVAAVVIGAAAMRTIARARRAERTAAAQLAAVQATGDPHATVVGDGNTGVADVIDVVDMVETVSTVTAADVIDTVSTVTAPDAGDVTGLADVTELAQQERVDLAA